MNRVRPSAIRELLRLGADPEVISFGGGYPDPLLFPIAELNAVFNEILAPGGSAALQYSPSDGLPSLRQQIAVRMIKDHVQCTEADVLIVQGAQQGLDLVAKLLLDPGDVVITEDPTFLGALIAFSPYEPEFASVRMDNDGMDVDHLEEVLAVNPRAKFIYTVPDFHNPTGVTMSLERRRKLVEVANRFDVIVLEDSPYRALRFEGEQLPTIKSFDTEGRVIYLGSFSKTLTPGMRLGWIVADEDIVSKLNLLKLAADTQSSTLNMTAASLFLEKFDLDSHIATCCVAYRRKRDLMLSTLDESLPPEVSYTRPAGGLFTWLTFPTGFDAAAFMKDELLPLAKVAYVPGASFFAVEQQNNHARMSYSGLSEERLVEGVRRLGDLLTSKFR